MIRHKFNASSTELDGIRFPSKKEAAVYRDLKLRQAAGEVVFFLMQVPLRLPGGVFMRIDFQVFDADGTVRFIDAKGVKTEAWEAKRRIAEAVYPIHIETA